MRNTCLFLILLIVFIIACDEGLSPDLANEKVGFGGTITFDGEWDSNINQTHVVAFKDPLLSVLDFNMFNLKFVSETIPNGSHVYKYSTNNDNSLISNIELGEISYIAVAQSKRDSITLNREDWIIVGLYYTNSDITEPGILKLSKTSFVDSINIHCDFNNPPPQPPGGVKLLNLINIIEYEYKNNLNSFNR